MVAIASPAEYSSEVPPISIVIDAALTHLLKSEQNIEDARGEYNLKMIQAIANTSVIGGLISLGLSGSGELRR
ncbi:DUF7386 family protein [Natrinema salsiterrestre]|uniref:DUF7386 family protein n=1 Tax=Natrinema salsiterrestre TaxID=2950540 RepID=UPI003CE58CD6